MTLAFSCDVKLCTKNYENLSIFVKVTAKKSVAPFFWTRCILKAALQTYILYPRNFFGKKLVGKVLWLDSIQEKILICGTFCATDQMAVAAAIALVWIYCPLTVRPTVGGWILSLCASVRPSLQTVRCTSGKEQGDYGRWAPGLSSAPCLSPSSRCVAGHGLRCRYSCVQDGISSLYRLIALSSYIPQLDKC